MSKKYIAVLYDNQTQEKLREWCIQNGFDLSCNYSGEAQDPNDFDFHTTVFYSTNEADPRRHDGEYKVEQSRVTPVGFKMLGEQQNVPVIQLAVTGYLKHLRDHFKRLGFEDKWDDYIPHISVSYAVDRPVDISSIELPTFPIFFDKLVVRDIVD